jgi:ribosomal protein S18 acetylase RimI-like enzyme
MADAAPFASSITSLGAAMGPAIGRHLDLAFRAIARGPNVVNGPDFLRLISSEPHPLGNFAVLTTADLASVRSAIEPLVAGLFPSAVLFPALTVPAEVDAFLVQQGFSPHGALPAMAIDIDRLGETALPEDCEFVRVGAGADGEEWVRQFAIGYELPLGVARYFSPVAVGADTAEDSMTQFYAIRRGGVIVSTSVCHLCDGLAGIYCVSTIPEQRRRGLGEHATAEALRRAAKLGYRVGILQSSEAGYPVYRKLGFADFGGVPLYVRIPS